MTTSTKCPPFADAIIGVYLECPTSGQVFRLDAVHYSATPGDYYFGLHRCDGKSEGITLWVNLDRYNEFISHNDY